MLYKEKWSYGPSGGQMECASRPPEYIPVTTNKIMDLEEARNTIKKMLHASLYGASTDTLLRIFAGEEQKMENKTIANGNFIVGSVRADGSLSFAERPVAHPTALSAKKEVERLLGLNPKERFAYLELKGVAYTQGVCWNTR